MLNAEGKMIKSIVDTTAGRLIIGELLPDNINISYKLVNKPMTKKDISAMIDSVYRHCSQKETVILADKLMALGFKYACTSGISFGMDDMVVPRTKHIHINETTREVKEFEVQYADGLITYGEKYNKAIDAWSRCTDKVATDMMKQISEGFEVPAGTPNQMKLNSIYMMATSGARGSAAQIKQLAGMRGLMATPSGEIIETPIISNFREGLTVLEYFNSTHGARKGLADTALKTASSGYLTRKLVDVALDCIITEEDCGTTEGIIARSIIDGGEVVVSLSDQILGRTAAIDTYHPITNQLLIKAGEIITESDLDNIDVAGLESIKLRSVLTCKTEEGMCARCYGRDLSVGDLVSVGEAVGVIAAQSIGEPGTQLTMRTFHIGGTATRGAEISSIESSSEAKVKIVNRNLVTNSDGRNVVMSRSCEIVLMDERGQDKAMHKVPYGATLLVDDGSMVTKGQKMAEWDPYTIPIITEKSGKVVFTDMVDGVSIRDITDETTGIVNKVIVEAKQHRGNELRPRIQLVDAKGETIILSNGLEARYYLPINAILSVEDGAQINAGDILSRIPRESSKTKDITGGLPRVTELVEARRPKDHAVIAEVDGRVEFGKDYKSKRRLIIHPTDGSEPLEFMVPKGKHVVINEGDFVKKGDMLIDGNPVLQDILKVMGVEALARYMVDEIQAVYRLQGVKIDDKHIEVIIRQMLQKVEVINSGDTTLMVGDRIDKRDLVEINDKAFAAGLRTAEVQPVLQGITKASLQTRSFISAASFQDTTRVLTEAAVAGKVDRLRGLKENVIVGRLIPAGTGFYMNRVKATAKALQDAPKAE